jgi:4-methylaminobutanoate oxidase (formaldehyde-forming)
MTPRDAEIAIVGGGIWGLSAAYHLARAGHTRIRVLERNAAVAAETTPRAAGLVGQIRSDATMLGAVQYALDLLGRFADETGHDPGLHQTGSLMVALTDERMAYCQQQVAAARANGVAAGFVDAAEMTRLAPALDTTRVAGAYFVEGDGYVDPLQCAQAYAGAARDLGVDIATGVQVSEIRIDRDQVVGVATTDGPLNAAQVLVAAGPWGAALARRAGFAPAVQPIRHQRVRTEPAPGIPDHHPVVRVPDVGCYLRPEKGGYLYGFFEPDPTAIDPLPDDFTTSQLEPPVATMTTAQRRLLPQFPVLADLDIAERIQGLTTFAPDGSYLLGPVPGVEGLFVATGCAALGIAGSAAIGQWLSRWMLEGNPGADLGQFGLERFGARADDRTWVRAASEQFYGTYYDIR